MNPSTNALLLRHRSVIVKQQEFFSTLLLSQHFTTQGKNSSLLSLCLCLGSGSNLCIGLLFLFLFLRVICKGRPELAVRRCPALSSTQRFLLVWLWRVSVAAHDTTVARCLKIQRLILISRMSVCCSCCSCSAEVAEKKQECVSLKPGNLAANGQQSPP